MGNALKLGLVATLDESAVTDMRVRGEREDIRSRGRRLVAHAEAAKSKMGPGYGTDVTDLTPAQYQARLRSLMRRG